MENNMLCNMNIMNIDQWLSLEHVRGRLSSFSHIIVTLCFAGAPGGENISLGATALFHSALAQASSARMAHKLSTTHCVAS